MDLYTKQRTSLRTSLQSVCVFRVPFKELSGECRGVFDKGHTCFRPGQLPSLLALVLRLPSWHVTLGLQAGLG